MAKETAATKSVAADFVSDGTYAPGAFGWEGGSGRLEYIRCGKLEVKNGQAFAELEFASDKYDFVKVSGVKYANEGTENSVFTVPVNLNANTEISGRTTAMSQPHWIDYRIYVYLSEADPGGAVYGKTAVDGEQIAAEAPEILGLSDGQPAGPENAELFGLYEYANGIRLLQIDVGTKSVLRAEGTDTAGEHATSRYQKNVISYLIAPEGTELPAGLSKALVVVRTPVGSSYAVENTKSIDYPDIVEADPGIVVLDGSQIKPFLWLSKGRKERAEELTRSLETLGLPLLFDRQSEEKGTAAKDEWEMVYELFK